MGKISQLQAELTEQAVELGFETLDEALNNGYEVDYEEKTLVNPYVLDKAQDDAHEAWQRERDIVVGDLTNLLIHRAFDHNIIERAIKFIKEAHD